VVLSPVGVDLSDGDSTPQAAREIIIISVRMNANNFFIVFPPLFRYNFTGLPTVYNCCYTGFMKHLLCGLHNRLFVKHTVQQLYPHGLILIAKDQVHPLLINLNGDQTHTMYPVETPSIDFAADEDTKGRYY